MGAYTCEFGVVHKVCRCPTPHTIKCNVPDEHGPDQYAARLNEAVEKLEIELAKVKSAMSSWEYDPDFGSEYNRLKGKIEGVKLALSYWEEMK